MEHGPKGNDRPASSSEAIGRPSTRAILQPLHPALQRRVPGGRKPFRPGPRPKLVERLHALPDRALGLHDDAGGRERGDEAALEHGRDRIATRLRVEIGRKGEQRIVLLGQGSNMRDGGGGLVSSGAGWFGHHATEKAFFR